MKFQGSASRIAATGGAGLIERGLRIEQAWRQLLEPVWVPTRELYRLDGKTQDGGQILLTRKV